MKRSVWYLVALVLLAGVAYLLWSQTPQPPDVVTVSTSTPATKQTVSEVHDENAEYKIDARYPQFGIPAVDVKVKATVEKAMAEFKEYPANPPEFGLPKNEQTITFDTVYKGSDVISAELFISEYTGGAHPNTVIIGINVDPVTGKELSLNDALALVGKTLEQVARESLIKLTAELGDDIIFPEGASAKKENYSTFLVSKDMVTFVFNNYQVAPYAAGQQYVTFDRVRRN